MELNEIKDLIKEAKESDATTMDISLKKLTSLPPEITELKNFTQLNIKSDENILLLGAGFSKNFGAPLANEMWYLIFNHKKIQAQPRIRELMLNNFDYELIYDAVLEGFVDNEGVLGKKCLPIEFRSDEKEAMMEATNFAYKHIDDVFMQYVNYLEKNRHEKTKQKEVLTGVSQFISLFQQVYLQVVSSDGYSIYTSDGFPWIVRSDKSSFIFTLNQDLFFEKVYNQNLFFDKTFQKICCNPGIENEQDSGLFNLPNEDKLRNNDIFSKENIFLIKLHGSYNWIGSNGKKSMVIGRHKEDKIKKEPLLNRYFETFKEVLSQGQRRLLIIGYGFGDDHINRVISNAVKNHELKVYILSSGSIQKLKEKLSENCEDFINIYNGISGYFPYTEILTGDSDLDKPIKEYFKSVFFDNDK